MAGIFANIDSDISKIRQLKSEIEKVKKALTSINVKVDIDIAKGMEAQLKSLTTQYDALVQKVAQADAKIAESTARINKSAETIIKAQEQMAKSSSGQGAANAQGASGGNTAATNAQTASVEAQARAYDELAEEIDAVMGTRSKNIRRMIEEQNAIRIINEEIKKLTKYQSGNSTLSASQQKRLEQLNASLLTHKTALSELRQSLNNSFKLDAAAATSMNALSQSLARMRMTYRELTEEERNSTFGKELLASIQQADAKIKQLDATIGNHQRNVGNYASGWNGLNMSIQQIGRELPSLAMGWNTFFLAISNNLPILTDEIKRAKDEYNRLKEAGQQATPVWKQVVSSLLSWQTALTVGITLLTLYGKDIIEWVGNLFKGEKQVDALAERMKSLNEIQRESGLSAAKERSELDVLYKATQDHTRSLQERNAAADELQKRYPKYFENLTNEAILAGNASGAYEQLTENILKAAQARAAQDKITKNYERMFQLQRAINADTNWTNRHRESAKGGTATTPVSVVQNMGSLAVQQLTDEAIEYNRRIEALKKNHEELKRLSKDNDYYASLIDMESFTEDYAIQASKATEQAKSYLDELAKLREKNEDREIDLMKEGTEKQLAEIELRYKREKEAIINQQRELAEANKDTGITSTNANGLTTGQQAEIDRANKLATESRKKQIEDVYRAETDAMLAYISEYGTFQQKKLAIAQEYAQKIADAQTEGDRLSLEKERDQKLSGMEAEALKMSIDWPAVFGEFGGMFDDIMKPTLEKVKQYMQTDDFRNLQPTDQSEIVEAVNRMEQSLGGAGKVSFKQLGKEVQTLQQSMRELNNAKQEEAEALQRLAEAQEAYENALANGTDREKAAAELKLNAAKEEADNASENTRKAEENAQQNQKTTTETATTLKANMENVTQGLQQLASGGIQAAYEGLLKLAKGSGNDKMGEISDKLGDVFIIGWILSILDILKDGLSTVVEGLLDGIFSAVSGILSDVLSGDLFVTLFDSIKSGVGSILDAITFGGFSSWTSSSNAKEVQATIDRLTDRNESLIHSLDALNDTMKDARGMETVDASKRAREMQEEINQNYLGIAMAQAGYHGSHHSWNKYWGGFTQDMIDRLSEQIGRDWSGSLWDLSPEEMKMLKSNADMWDLIQNTGEGGYGSRLTDKLDDYIDQAGKLEEITDTLNETLTQISFDSMYDSFIDSLMDMEYSAEDAADNIAEYFMRAMLSNKIGAMYADKLEDWYKRFAGAMENDGMLDDSEIDSLRDEYLGYVEEALKLRDELAAATGYEGTSAQEQQSATSRGFETMTQDQASELNGRFTALYESSLRQESIQQGIGNIAEDARNIIAQSYLELQQISENTGAIIIPIQKIQKDIEQVKQNTSRL